MTRRQLLATAGLAAAPISRRPNLLLILADDMGAGDLSCYAAPDIKTPNIDSIARRGVRFTRCYANAPECTPTRTALMTGRYQQRVGGLECAIGVGNVGRYDEAEWLARRGELGLPVSETSIARMLKGAGYDTCCSGKWHLGYLPQFSPNAHGFDEYFGILGGNADYFTHREESGANVLAHNGRLVERPGYLTDLLADHALGWLRAEQRKQKPWFLYLPFTAPHTPLQGPTDGPVLDKSKWNEGSRATYVAMVQHMDKRVGEVLEQVRRMGGLDNTLIVFKSDNGGYAQSRNAGLRGGKSTVWEGGIRVPCVMQWPGVLPEASTTTQVAISMDVTATMLAAAQVKPARPLDGMDLLPVLRGQRQAVSRTLFWSYKREHQRRWAVRDGDMKYVRDGAFESLHNLAWDEREKVNLAENEPALRKQLVAKLDAWLQQTTPPRLRDYYESRAISARHSTVRHLPPSG